MSFALQCCSTCGEKRPRRRGCRFLVQLALARSRCFRPTLALALTTQRLCACLTHSVLTATPRRRQPANLLAQLLFNLSRLPASTLILFLLNKLRTPQSAIKRHPSSDTATVTQPPHTIKISRPSCRSSSRLVSCLPRRTRRSVADRFSYHETDTNPAFSDRQDHHP
jgi:hypothetical protein